jgi:hypothetical protein
MTNRTIEMKFEQIVRLIIDDLKEVIKLNGGDDGDAELVKSCVCLLRHYMTNAEFDDWFDEYNASHDSFPMERPH